MQFSLIRNPLSDYLVVTFCFHHQILRARHYLQTLLLGFLRLYPCRHQRRKHLFQRERCRRKRWPGGQVGQL